MLASAFLEFARLELEDRHFGEALAILNDARSLRPEPAVLERVNFLAAQIQYHGKNYDAAIADFEQIGRSDSTLAPVAMFNAALSWLQKGDDSRFLADAEEFGNKTKGEKSPGEPRLEAGLMEAAKGDSRAADSLRNFLHDFPESERASEAWVALAELAFHATPPRIDEARKNLARAAESKPTATAQERADYLTIWLEDATSGGEAKVIELAKRFIQQHESSNLVASVRMKLGEMYYRAEDFANAETQFELLTEQHSAGAFTERALFFAGESAMAGMAAQSLDRALVLFDRVVQLNGELKWAARNEQAVIELPHSPVSTPFSMKEIGPMGHMNFSGFTNRALTPASCSRRMLNGNQPRPFTKNLQPRAGLARMKRANAWIAFVSSTFCDRNDGAAHRVFPCYWHQKGSTLQYDN